MTDHKTDRLETCILEKLFEYNLYIHYIYVIDHIQDKTDGSPYIAVFNNDNDSLIHLLLKILNTDYKTIGSLNLVFDNDRHCLIQIFRKILNTECKQLSNYDEFTEIIKIYPTVDLLVKKFRQTILNYFRSLDNIKKYFDIPTPSLNNDEYVEVIFNNDQEPVIFKIAYTAELTQYKLKNSYEMQLIDASAKDYNIFRIDGYDYHRLIFPIESLIFLY